MISSPMDLYEQIFVCNLFLCILGNILQASKLQGAMIYSFTDLKSATKSFSEDYKIGEGGFGDVYKVIS